MPTLCLRCTRSFGSLVWHDVLHCSSVAFLLPPLPPSAFLVESLPLLPSFFVLFSFFFLVLEVCSFYVLWASGLNLTGVIVGGWVQGGLVAGLRVGRPVGVLPPWGVIAVAAPWPIGTQPPT